MRKFSRLFFEQAGRPQALLIATALLALVGLNGCSVGLSLSQYGERTEPHYFEAGSNRKTVEKKFGKAIEMELNDDGSKVGTYQEKVYRYSPFWYGEPPWLRALFHLGLDLQTFGLWEVVATPIELGGKVYRATHKDKYNHTVVYDTADRMVSQYCGRRSMTWLTNSPPEKISKGDRRKLTQDNGQGIWEVQR